MSLPPCRNRFGEDMRARARAYLEYFLLHLIIGHYPSGGRFYARARAQADNA